MSNLREFVERGLERSESISWSNTGLKWLFSCLRVNEKNPSLFEYRGIHADTKALQNYACYKNDYDVKCTTKAEVENPPFKNLEK